MAMPMRLFWLLSNTIPRLEADRDRRALRIAACAQSDESTTGLLEQLNDSVGEVVRVSPTSVIAAPVDHAGLNALRGLAQFG
jgi:hypothetical protein